MPESKRLGAPQAGGLALQLVAAVQIILDGAGDARRGYGSIHSSGKGRSSGAPFSEVLQKMVVRIDQPRQHGFAARVDDLGVPYIARPQSLRDRRPQSARRRWRRLHRSGSCAARSMVITTPCSTTRSTGSGTGPWLSNDIIIPPSLGTAPWTATALYRPAAGPARTVLDQATTFSPSSSCRWYWCLPNWPPKFMAVRYITPGTWAAAARLDGPSPGASGPGCAEHQQIQDGIARPRAPWCPRSRSRSDGI